MFFGRDVVGGVAAVSVGGGAVGADSVGADSVGVEGDAAVSPGFRGSVSSVVDVAPTRRSQRNLE